MRLTEYPNLGEKVYALRLENGLEVRVLPKPGFARKYAYLVTDYGSIDMDFETARGKVHSPAGVAHYLEHKMFDLPDRDVMAEFAALGASPNAFTSYDMTAYYFSCTEHFDRCLRLLLEFVYTPYFTQESVEKERGIIGQEIRMYDDSPDSRVYDLLFAAMYRTHPVRVPIIGTVETISHITPQTLMDCYSAFYTPSNMILCVVGDVDPEQVAAIAREGSPRQARQVPGRCYGPAEEMTCPQTFVSRRMDVSMPMFQLGFKSAPAPAGRELYRQEILGDLAADVLFSESSELYLRLYDEGLIDSSFSGGFEAIKGVAMLTCGGGSINPQAVRDAILEAAEKLLVKGVDDETLNRAVKSAMGRRVRSLDSFDSTCFRICSYHLDGVDYLDFPALYAQVSGRDVCEFIRENVTKDRCALSVIYPRNWEESI